MDGELDVESLTTSLVREFLSRKGLTETLASLELESPRTDHLLTNRVQLARTIGVDKLMRKNKESDVSYRTILEVVTANYIEKLRQKNGVSTTTSLEAEKPSTSSKMYRRMKIDENQSAASADNDLVLEDTEEGETFLGEGNVANQRPDSGHVTGSQARMKQKPAKGRITSNLNDEQQKKLKRQLNKPRYLVDDDKKEDSFVVPSPESRNVHRSSPTGKSSPTGVVRSGKSTPENRGSFNEKFDQNETESRKVKKDLDVRRILQEAEIEPPAPVSVSKRVEEKEPPPKESSKKPKTRAELLAMLDLRDPNTIGPNALKEDSTLVDEPTSKLGDLELGDLDDDELAEVEVIERVPAKVAATINRPSTPIDLKTAQDLKKVIFGTALQQFYEEWNLQGFTFCNKDDLKYGIVQEKGGPCGMLASVQACCLQEMLFSSTAEMKIRKLNPTRSERTEALSKAISTILWRCGGSQTATVALPGNRAFFSGSNVFKADYMTEFLMLTEFDDFNELNQFIRTNIALFESRNTPAVIILLYSAILSRTVEGVKSDMDDRNGRLMGQHYYCTQEMVNLILTGRAVSNTFNDTIQLGSDDEVTILKGLNKRSDIGFLSLFEHFESCEVGTFYKTPKYPIWVVCCESHYSVLFAMRKELMNDWRVERHFDLYFYDGLAKQDEEIKLTVDTTNRYYDPPQDEDMVPPLENCIRTKWPEAAIDWNGTEPLL